HFLRVLSPWAAFDAACNIHGIGANEAYGLGYIFRIQPACKDQRQPGLKAGKHAPGSELSGPAVHSGDSCVHQHRGGELPTTVPTEIKIVGDRQKVTLLTDGESGNPLKWPPVAYEMAVAMPLDHADLRQIAQRFGDLLQ